MRFVTRLLGVACLAGILGGATNARAIILTGGDAATQASATAILDIVFVIDTSGSMSDDITAIGDAATAAIRDLECPECDVWIRARFMGITGNYGSVFNENVKAYVLGLGETPVSNHSEDNGPAVLDLVNHYAWNNDALPGQNYFKAVVTIGDEGTENGSPVDAADYLAAYNANQAAIANDVFLFSWVTDDPYTGVPGLFQAMAEGGTLGGYTYGDTGGKYVSGGADSGADGVQAKLEDILCTAAGGGTGTVPDSAQFTLAMALLSLAAYARLARTRRS